MSVEWQFLITLNEQLRRLRDPIVVQEVAARLLGEHLHASRVHYAQIDGHEFVIRRAYTDGVPPFVGRGSVAQFGDAVIESCRRGETVIVDDVSTDPRFTTAEREQLLAARTAAFVGTPLIKGGRWLGTFGVHSITPRTWTRDQIALIEVTAERMWGTGERARAEEALDRSESRQTFLLRLSDATRSLSDDAAIQDTAARHLAEYLGADRVGFAEPDGGEYVIRHEYSRGAALVGEPVRITLGPALGQVLQRGETVVVSDVESDRRLTADDRTAFRSRQVASYVALALVKEGRMVATFGASHDTPRVWTPREIEFVREVAQRTWDAVDRTRADAALRQQKTRLSLALQASAGGSWTWDLRTNDTHWDDAFRKQFGFTPDEPPIFETWFARLHVEDRAWMRRTFEEVLQSRDTWDHTYRISRPDGSERWMHSLGRADRDTAGHVTRLTGLELDVTERRRAEDAQQARRDEEYDRTLRTLLETATQGIVSADARGTLMSTNRAVEQMFGWAADELIGQPIERLIPSISRDGAPRQGGLNLVGARKDGSKFPIEVTVNHVPTRSGGRVFVFVTDITERQRAAVALQERTTELEYRTTQLSQMAWDLTLAEHHAREEIARTLHDGLQQLLVIVALNLEQLMKREIERGAPSVGLLAEAKQQLNEAMAVARSLNVELFPPVLQRSGLPAALKWLASWTRDKYKVSVEVSVDSRADSTRKDVRTLLFESVRELLFNAVKYAKTDGVTLALELDPNDQLCITVTDQGVGFEPARLDDRSKSGQVGWGLFRIRERLTLLGGRLDIDSAPGSGTRIRLVAPRDAANDTIAGAAQTRPQPPSAASAIDDGRAAPDALRILIADDHPPVRRALREMLQQRPQLLVVGDACNGFEAIALAHTLRPDVILMDVSMPHMDGVEATTRIRAELPDIRILGVSTLARNESADALEQAGAADFFVKGTDTQRLIDHLLGFHASRDTGARARS